MGLSHGECAVVFSEPLRRVHSRQWIEHRRVVFRSAAFQPSGAPAWRGRARGGHVPGFNAQLPVARTIRGLAIVNHNLSLSGTYRLKLTNEAGATNLVLQSEDFSQAVWTKTSMSVGSGSAGPGRE